MQEIAQEARLDVNRFMEDLKSNESCKLVGQDHSEAIEKYKVFGVPTLVFDESHPCFLKLGRLPGSKEEHVTFYQELRELTTKRPYLLEIKRT